MGFQVENLKLLPIPIKIRKELLQKLHSKVSALIKNQKSNRNFEYSHFDQIEIDHLVYKIFSLNKDDINEVDNWFFRRYPVLAKTIECKINGNLLKMV